jgi:hypothetical protein
MRTFTARGLVMGVLGAVMVAASPAIAGFAAPAPAVAMIAASPSTDLADGQQVTVTGTGYPANHTVDLVECAQDLGCDFSNLRVLGVDGAGSYTSPFVVRRILTLGSLQVDCAVGQNCILVSLDITDLSAGAQTVITFDPDIPPLPAPNFRFTPDRTGHVRVDKGVARITGTLRCNQDLFVDAFMTLTQVWHAQIFRSEAFVGFDCTKGSTRFAVVFRPGNGLFGEGAATLDIDAFAGGSVFVEKHKKVTVTLVAS